MPEFYLADVRKRANPDFNMSPQAIPESRNFSDEPNPDFQRLTNIFLADEIPDDPVPTGIPGAENITMEWTTGESFGQIDFYGPGNDEPERFLSLYLFSGKNPAQDKAAMKHLEQYADFSQCLNFPLILQVTEDPLAAQWQHDALQSLRKGISPLIAAFLKAYFPTEKSSGKI